VYLLPLEQLPDVSGPPLAAIIKFSLIRGFVPDVWQLSRVTPSPKTSHTCSAQSDL
jgi:hypothetical protein